jgi:glycosyltransferase involved in cell wall biosynthesis
MYNNKSFSLVFPAFNEEKNIKETIHEFEDINFFDEIIIVDNNSTDNTATEIKQTKSIYVLEKKQGYGAALRRGLEETKGDYIVMCEPDGTFSANDIYKFLPYINDFDCVFGTRTYKPFIQKGAKMYTLLRWGNFIVAKFLEIIFSGPRLSDVGCTYKLLSRDSYNQVGKSLSVIGSEFQPELMIKLILSKKKIIEIPVNYLKRKGESKITHNFFATSVLAIKMIILIIKLRLKSIF